jgi:hypothetical protein
MRQSIRLAETGNGRYCATWSRNPYLFVQHVHYLRDDSQEAVAGYEIKTVVGKWEVQSVALIKGKLFCQGITGCQLVSHLKQSPIRIQPNHLSIWESLGQQAGQKTSATAHFQNAVTGFGPYVFQQQRQKFRAVSIAES